jgi:hypothetical protein
MHSEPLLFQPRASASFSKCGVGRFVKFCGVSVGWPPDLLCWLLVYDRAEMWPVCSLIVGLTDFLSIFCKKINIVAFFM